jgi:DnaJ-class molecular chaperone
MMYDDYYLEVDVEDCPVCDGEGVVSDEYREVMICTECSGSGLVVHRNPNKFKNNNHLKKDQ